MKLRALWLFAFCFLLSALSARAATVADDLRRASESAAITRVIFTPTNYPVASGSHLVLGGAISVTASNGLFSQRLAANDYVVSFVPPAGSFIISVPESTNTFTLTDLAVNLPSYTYTNPFPDQLISKYVRLGTNLVALTNQAGLPGEYLVLSATGTGTGGSMDYTVTNSFATTNYVKAAVSNAPTIYAPTILGSLNATDEAANFGLIYAQDIVVNGGAFNGNGWLITNINWAGISTSTIPASVVVSGAATPGQILTVGAADTVTASDPVSTNGLQGALGYVPATNSLAGIHAALGYAPQLGSANLSNWSSVAVFSTNGLTGTDGGSLTNLKAANIVSGTNTASVGVGTLVASGHIYGVGQTNSGNLQAASANVTGRFTLGTGTAWVQDSAGWQLNSSLRPVGSGTALGAAGAEWAGTFKSVIINGGSFAAPTLVFRVSTNSGGATEFGGSAVASGFIYGNDESGPAFLMWGNSPGSGSIFSGGMSGEAYRRTRITSAGRYLLGGGAAATDTSFERISAGTLLFQTNIVASGNFTSTNGTFNGSARGLTNLPHGLFEASYQSNVTATTVSAAHTWTLVQNNLTITDMSMGGFVVATNAVVWTNTYSAMVHMAATITYINAGNSTLKFSLAKNGTRIPASEIWNTGNATDYESTALHPTIFSVAPGDTFQLYGLNTANNNFTVVNLNIVGMHLR